MLSNSQRYKILNTSKNYTNGDLKSISELYGPDTVFEEGYYKWRSEITYEEVIDESIVYSSTDESLSIKGTNDVFDIYYRMMGNNRKSPPILMIPSIPFNIEQYSTVQR